MSVIETITGTTGSKSLRQTQHDREKEGKGRMQGKSVSIHGAASSNHIELPEGMWERVAKQAYELWEQRGCREGRDMEDWLDAEAIVMEQIHETRE